MHDLQQTVITTQKKRQELNHIEGLVGQAHRGIESAGNYATQEANECPQCTKVYNEMCDYRTQLLLMRKEHFQEESQKSTWPGSCR
jgi:hypothetical protein